MRTNSKQNSSALTDKVSLQNNNTQNIPSCGEEGSPGLVLPSISKTTQ